MNITDFFEVSDVCSRYCSTFGHLKKRLEAASRAKPLQAIAELNPGQSLATHSYVNPPAVSLLHPEHHQHHSTSDMDALDRSELPPWASTRTTSSTFFPEMQPMRTSTNFSWSFRELREKHEMRTQNSSLSLSEPIATEFKPVQRSKVAFLSLSAELRIQIYKYALAIARNAEFKVTILGTDNLILCSVAYADGPKWEYQKQLQYSRTPDDTINTALLRSCKQIHFEALPLLFEKCSFQFANNEGLVPAFYAHLTEVGRRNIIKVRLGQPFEPQDVANDNIFLSNLACKHLSLFPNLATCEVGTLLDLGTWMNKERNRTNSDGTSSLNQLYPNLQIKNPSIFVKYMSKTHGEIDPSSRCESSWFLELLDPRTSSTPVYIMD
jgi:hypothetical protein